MYCIHALQATLQEALDKYCPRARTSPQAQRNWTPQASELLAGARQARCRHNKFGLTYDLQSYKALSNQLKKEIRRVSRDNWRRFLEEATTAPGLPYKKGLWKLSRWSWKVGSGGQPGPHLPALRRTTHDQPTQDNAEKMKILAEKFFPATGQADLSDTAGGIHEGNSIAVPQEVSPHLVEETIQKLPNNKAPGPDGIPNEALKEAARAVSKELSAEIS